VVQRLLCPLNEILFRLRRMRPRGVRHDEFCHSSLSIESTNFPAIGEQTMLP
jgi:hypothetical protein